MSDLTTVTTEQLGETLGEFRPYDPQVIPAHIEKTRIVKCLYKATANNKEPRSNEYVRIPDHITEESVQEHMSDLMDYFIGFLQDTEDSMIKADHKAYVSKVYTEYLSIPKIIEYLESQEASGRLTKEKIAAWFKDYMEDQLVELFLTKTDDPAKIEAIINAYKAKFESLAGGRTFIKPADCEAMLKAMEQVNATGKSDVMNTSIAKRFVKRLESMDEKVEETLASL